MFNIHVKLFGGNWTYEECVKMMLRRFVQPHIKWEVTEVYMLFDTQPNADINPKQWEQHEQDKSHDIYMHIYIIDTD